MFLLFHLVLKILVTEMNHSVKTWPREEKAVTILPLPVPSLCVPSEFLYVLNLEHLLSHSSVYLGV